MNEMKVSELQQQALKLPVEQRNQLADLLWESTLEPLTAEEKALLDDRLAAHRAHPDAVSGWDEVKARLARRQ